MSSDLFQLETNEEKPFFVCPSCKTELNPDSHGLSYVCGCCASVWPIQNGIPCFVSKDILPDYGLATDMSDLVSLAHSRGWLAALEKHLGHNEARREYVREYVASERRGDFRFLIPMADDATVLDIGSGWGNIAIAFARNCGRVFALDTTLANVQFVGIRAQQEGIANLTPILGDATCLPLPPASCDGVLMVGVLEWVAWGHDTTDPLALQRKALAEACQVLKPGGTLYIGIENRYGFKSFLGAREPHTGLRFISLLPRAIGNAYSEKARGQPFREYTYSQKGLVGLLKGAGFSDIRVYYPIPNYQNFRYITDYSAPWISRFLLTRYAGHGSFSPILRLAGLVASVFRIERLFSTCFSVVASKSSD